MAAAISLDADPTFRAKVPIHVPGRAEPVALEFEFVHMPKDDFERFIRKGADDLSDLAYVMKITTGWGLKDPFTERNVGLLLDNYAASAEAIVRTWCAELTGHKVG